jgi:hypothetical protein
MIHRRRRAARRALDGVAAANIKNRGKIATVFPAMKKVIFVP